MIAYFRKLTRTLLTGYGPILTAAALILVVLCSIYAATGSVARAWHAVGVPSLDNSFGDLRVITYSIPCEAAGVDPYVKDACNTYWKQNPQQEVPYQEMLLNYPPIWLKSSYLGVSPGLTNVLGVAIAVAAILSLCYIFRPRTVVGGLIAISAALSPSILLGFERGNIDLVIFSLLVFIVTVTERLTPALRSSVRGAGIVLLTVLKFFPVACITLLIRSRKSWVIALATGVLAVIAAWLVADGKFVSVLSNTPKIDTLAFGSLPLLIGLGKAFGGDGVVSRGTMMLALFMSVAAFLVVFVPTLMRKLARPFPQYLPAIDDSLNGSLALAGMSIFCAAFLFGASFDYRLIFLTLTLPLLIAAYEDDLDRSRRLYAPLAIVLFLWLSRATVKVAYLDELLDWMIFAVGSAWISSGLLLSSKREN